MKIGPNKYQLFGKLCIVGFLILFVGMFSFFHPSMRSSDGPTITQIILLIAVSLSLLFMVILMILQLLLLPIEVIIDKDEKLLSLAFLSGRRSIIYLTDIENYFGVNVKTKSTIYSGIILHTTGKEDYLLGDFSLNGFTPIQSFLKENNIVFMGNKKFSFITYFIDYFKN